RPVGGAGRAGAARTGPGDPGVAPAAAAAAGVPGAAVLRRPVRGPDRGHDGDQPGRGEEPRVPRDGRPARHPGRGGAMRPEDNGGLADLLRKALREEADRLPPRGDGLVRIRDRVAVRRRRLSWLRPVLVVATAAGVAAAAGAVPVVLREFSRPRPAVTGAAGPAARPSAAAPGRPRPAAATCARSGRTSAGPRGTTRPSGTWPPASTRS